jgi:hypothetical protein
MNREAVESDTSEEFTYLTRLAKHPIEVAKSESVGARTNFLTIHLLGTLFLLLFILNAGVAVAQTTPDCSNVTYSGDGTGSNPYEVGNVDQLQCMNQDPTANYTQTSEINASETESWNGGSGFSPIGDAEGRPFNGTFEGSEHRITNLTIEETESTTGLFGVVSNGTIANISLVGVSVHGSGLTGGLIAYNNGTVTNSTVTGSVSGDSGVGGLVGRNTGVISGSSSDTTVNNTRRYAGSLVGTNNGIVRNSYATGRVTAERYGVGGLVGRNYGGSVLNSHATGNVSSESEAGGLVGDNSGNVTDSYATGNVSVEDFIAGGIVGDNGYESTIKRSYSTGDVNAPESAGGFVGWNAGYISDSYSIGDVNASSENIGGFVGWNREDIYGSYSTGDVNGSKNVGGFVGMNGWSSEVIGSHATGSANGTEAVGGFVGYNFGGIVDGARALGDTMGSTYVGGFVGRNEEGFVTASNATGSVGGVDYVGGFAGNNTGTVFYSYANGTVSGTHYVGGLVGENEVEGNISKTYSRAPVNGELQVGGLVGINRGKVSNSYSTGSVDANSEAGGFVADNVNGTVSGSYWDRISTGVSYSDGGVALTTSEMTGDEAPDDMVNFDFTLTWRTVPSDYPTFVAGAGRGSLGPDCSEVTYSGDGTESNPYEVENVDQLQCITKDLNASYEQVSDIDANATSSWNYEIGFQPLGGPSYIREPFNGTYDGTGHRIVGLTIDRYVDGEGLNKGRDASVFGVVGESGIVRNVSILGLEVSGSEAVGGIASLNRGYLSDVEVEGEFTKGEDFLGYGPYVGGVAGRNIGNISESYVNGTVDGRDRAYSGGVVGVNDGSVKSSFSDASVVGSPFGVIAGGLVGLNDEGVVADSGATGRVNASYVGGLIGLTLGNVLDSYATGDVTGNQSVGGLIGKAYRAEVRGSYATGEVDGGEMVGGLIGATEGGTVIGSYATGNVTGRNEVGGLVGRLSNDDGEPAVKQDSVSSANTQYSSSMGVNESSTPIISGEPEQLPNMFEESSKIQHQGSVSSRHRNTSGKAFINETYATGRVNGSQDVGGLVANRSSGTEVTDSYWDVPATGTSTSKGGTGIGDINETPPADGMVGTAPVRNMTGFDFTSRWRFITSPDGYPVLRWQSAGRDGPPYFSIFVTGTNSPLVEGDEVFVNVTITNLGESNATQSVKLATPDLGNLTSSSGIISPGGRTNLSFILPTERGDAGDRIVNVSSRNETTSVRVDILTYVEFTQPLPVSGFRNPPRNTKELHPLLYEDLDGDGDGKQIEETVRVFRELVRGNSLNLSEDQALRLDWDQDSHRNVTVGDMVSLFGEQIRAD